MRRFFGVFVPIAVLVAVAMPSALADDVGSGHPLMLQTYSPSDGPTIAWFDNFFVSNTWTFKEFDSSSVPTVSRDVGGTTTSDPDTSEGGDHLVARGGDGAIWYNHRSFDTWGGWVSLGGSTNAGPSVASWFDTSRTFVVARGDDNALWATELTASGPVGWVSVGGELSSDPDASIGADGVLYVTARGANGETFINAYNGTTWGGWAGLGGVTTSGPSIAYNGGQGYILTRGGDNAIWANHLIGGVWGGWFPLGGLVAPQPNPRVGGYAIDVDIQPESDLISFITVGVDRNIWQGIYDTANGPSFAMVAKGT
jgi:hypothetical protein